MAGGMVEVGRATVTIIPNMQGAQTTIAEQLTGAGTQGGEGAGRNFLSGLGDALGGLAGKLGGIAEAGGAGLAATLGTAFEGALGTALPVAAIAGFTALIYDIGLAFEDVENTIIIGTGASGEALRGMVEDVKAVTDTLPTSAQDASSVIADLNTRMGLTGDEAQNLGRQILEVGKMTGKSLDVNALTGMFNQFSISGADATAAMDTMWAVSQNTGISFQSLTSTLKSNAGQLQMLGFSFEDSAAMAGALDKAGIDANSVMGKMGKALTTLAKDGEEPKEAFARTTSEIQNLVAKGDEAAALDLASELFGTRGAAQFVNAVKSGAMNVDDFSKIASLAGGNIDETAEQTMTLGDKFEILKNQVINALEPLGSGLMEGLQAGMDVIVAAFETAMPYVQQFFGELAGPVVEAAGPAIQSLGEQFQNLANEVLPVLQAAFEAIWPAVTTVAHAIGTVLGTAFSAIVGIVQTVIAVISPLVSAVMPALQVAAETVAPVFENAFSLIEQVFSQATSAIQGAVSQITQLLSFQGVSGAVLGVFQSVKQAITSPMEAARNAIKGIIDRIKGFFRFKVPTPKIPLPHFGISPSGWKLDDLLKGSIPSLSIKWYGTGGFTNGTMVGYGERGTEFVWPEYSPYFEKYADALASRIDTGRDVVAWLDANLGQVISAYAPTATPREFGRMVRRYV